MPTSRLSVREDHGQLQLVMEIQSLIFQLLLREIQPTKPLKMIKHLFADVGHLRSNGHMRTLTHQSMVISGGMIPILS